MGSSRSEALLDPSGSLGPACCTAPTRNAQPIGPKLDVLLHAMVHKHQHEILGKTDACYHGLGPAFRDTANRKGRELGLPRVRTCKARGADAALPSASH